MNRPSDARSRREAIVEAEGMLWGHEVALEYHAVAERHMRTQWNGMIEPVLAPLDIDYRHSADFACGYGRNAVMIRPRAETLTLIDVNEDNIAFCRKRFADDAGIRMHLCNGYDLNGLADGAFTFLYTWDAMVHFDLEIIAAYMPEIFRVMAPGGHVFCHHSNYDKAPGADFRGNPHWRNFMNGDIFRHLAVRNGFQIVGQHYLDWDAGAYADRDIAIDCVTVCVKPS